MTISVKIIEDSISPSDIRLTTMQLRYPRFIHAEFMTHRLFSRNASSSRAIPVKKMIEDLRRDPAMPVFWGSNKSGMQAGAELEMHDLLGAKCVWIAAMEDAIAHAETLMGAGLHKQIANRILEPWAHINVVVTATEFKNFFALRRHKDAQPEIKELADKMYEARSHSLPSLIGIGRWHLPYILGSDWEALKEYVKKGRITRDEPNNTELIELAKKVSAARCARVSYLTHDGRKTTVEEDLALFEKLLVSTPLHASPAEHQATPDEPKEKPAIMTHNGGWELNRDEWKHSHEWGNFIGWRQHRKMLPNEFIEG